MIDSAVRVDGGRPRDRVGRAVRCRQRAQYRSHDLSDDLMTRPISDDDLPTRPI